MVDIGSIIKNNKIIYGIYFYTLSSILSAIKLFVKVDDHLILFNSFGGRK